MWNIFPPDEADLISRDLDHSRECGMFKNIVTLNIDIMGSYRKLSFCYIPMGDLLVWCFFQHLCDYRLGGGEEDGKTTYVRLCESVA